MSGDIGRYTRTSDTLCLDVMFETKIKIVRALGKKIKSMTNGRIKIGNIKLLDVVKTLTNTVD